MDQNAGASLRLEPRSDWSPAQIGATLRRQNTNPNRTKSITTHQQISTHKMTFTTKQNLIHQSSLMTLMKTNDTKILIKKCCYFSNQLHPKTVLSMHQYFTSIQKKIFVQPHKGNWYAILTEPIMIVNQQWQHIRQVNQNPFTRLLSSYKFKLTISCRVQDESR